MRIDSYIEPRKLLGVSGLFSVNTSAGVIEGNSDYTRTELDGVTVFEYTLDGVRLTAEFSEKANGAVIRQDYFENTSDAPVHIYKIASRFHMDGNEYDVYTQYNGWQNENKGGWQRLVTQVTTAGLGIRTCEGAAPIMALHSKYTGKNTVFHLLPNGQWSMTAKKFPVSKNEHVVVEMGLHDDCLDLTVTPGERISLPTVIFFTAESKVDLDAYKLHEVYNELYPRRELPIFYNSWLYCFDRLDIDALLKQVDAAADLGFEGFMILFAKLGMLYCIRLEPRRLGCMRGQRHHTVAAVDIKHLRDRSKLMCGIAFAVFVHILCKAVVCRLALLHFSEYILGVEVMVISAGAVDDLTEKSHFHHVEHCHLASAVTAVFKHHNWHAGFLICANKVEAFADIVRTADFDCGIFAGAHGVNRHVGSAAPAVHENNGVNLIHFENILIIRGCKRLRTTFFPADLFAFLKAFRRNVADSRNFNIGHVCENVLEHSKSSVAESDISDINFFFHSAVPPFEYKYILY